MVVVPLLEPASRAVVVPLVEPLVEIVPELPTEPLLEPLVETEPELPTEPLLEPVPLPLLGWLVEVPLEGLPLPLVDPEALEFAGGAVLVSSAALASSTPVADWLDELVFPGLGATTPPLPP
jgi:hypothetical protein